jgi:hypothetical protein
MHALHGRALFLFRTSLYSIVRIALTTHNLRGYKNNVDIVYVPY